ncbi:peptide chain release factor 2 [Opitutales bacterium CLA-KB-P66]|uniref:Peptide chain release factor 2 n=1 Tax=Intestinicryptomonas porci TaxID=2926320 RepID=A0ABU4WG75_9BACT|nr:peptide chain release factor 2 [Opitutales bacterium CLA-KB-P66]
MIIDSEIKNDIAQINKRAAHLWRFLDVPKKQEEIAQLEEKMGAADFWNDRNSAQEILSEASRLKRIVAPQLDFQKRLGDLNALLELAEESDEDADLSAELASETNSMSLEIEKVEIESFLSGKLDNSNAIVTIHAGAGGTESCDWAEMLLRMYTRWAERRGWKCDVQDIVAGEEAGVAKVTIRIEGANAYGYAKAERGVHRLVRISPFDANKRRHTSFASVDIIAEIEDDVEIEIKDEELRIDTYRSSGKGGQHVNKTDSAVRITHIPTGIVVACQNERSQLKNKQTAMKILKSRLYEKLEDEKRAEMDKFYGEKGEIAWGNQIRSYVFQPYQMVKDLRTGAETGNIQAVMDGDIDMFVNAWLRAGGPTSRNKNYLTEE